MADISDVKSSEIKELKDNLDKLSCKKLLLILGDCTIQELH